MTKIIYDNIIYSLQQSGGISSTWAVLQNHMLQEADFECAFIERKDAKNNIYRQGYDLSKSSVINQINLPCCIERYLTPHVGTIEQECVFHSSYYRTVKNKLCRKVVTVHDFIYEKFMNGLQRKVHCAQKYNAINNADIIVCVSHNTREDLFKYLPEIDKKKVVVVYNGISSDFYKIANASRGDRLLYVGGRFGYKNFDLLIEALSEMSYSLDICGAPLSAKEKKYLDNHLGENRYEVHTNVDNRRLNELYNQALCLVYPSLYEGFGLPIIEAQKVGCPVIALDASATLEVMGNSPLLMPNGDCRTMKKYLKMLQSPTLIEDAIMLGIENSHRFDSQNMFKSYKEIYKGL